MRDRTFSVCVLVYGSDLALADRCLGSIERSADWSAISEVRIGLNALSSSQRAGLMVASDRISARVPVITYEHENGSNVGKYPLMLRMFYDAGRPIQSSRVMWFDDDSFVRGSDTGWWRVVSDRTSDYVMSGEVWKLCPPGFRRGQREAIKQQRWYGGKPLDAGYLPAFCTGAWWVARKDKLAEFRYPFPEIYHNGGDSLLGELCRQQSWSVLSFNSGIAINADSVGRGSKARRRGMSSRWPWEGWDGVSQVDLSHQEFATSVTEYRGGKATQVVLSPRYFLPGPPG